MGAQAPTPQNPKIMIVSINNTDEQRSSQSAAMAKEHGTCTVTIYDNNTQCVAYGDSASAIHSSCGVRLNDTRIQSVTFPHTALDFYLPKLVRDGYKVALLDD